MGPVSETARNSVDFRDFYHDRGCDIDVPHDTEIIQRIYENADSESAYNENQSF